ncbi:hypothetical protein BLOT_011306 [Blomia tropicalis]|nr:hypothetical protein BLOT_011306 [Blomia tropicalis]
MNELRRVNFGGEWHYGNRVFSNGSIVRFIHFNGVMLDVTATVQKWRKTNPNKAIKQMVASMAAKIRIDTSSASGMVKNNDTNFLPPIKIIKSKMNEVMFDTIKTARNKRKRSRSSNGFAIFLR